MQRQARRRLIGAVALMLALVIFLPMIFDADPAVHVTRDIELRIPSRTVDSPEPVVNEVVQQSSAVAVIPEMQPVVASEVSPVAAPSVQPLAVTGKIVKPAAVPPSKPVATAPPKPVATAPSKPVATAPSKSVATAPSKSAGWVIQVGAYSKEESAIQMVANLKQRGYPVYTERVGKMVRVRVGNYPSREAADKVRARLEKIGLHPNVLGQE